MKQCQVVASLLSDTKTSSNGQRKNTLIKRLWILLVAILAFPAMAKPLSEQALVDKTEAFIAAKNARQQPKSNEADVDHFISFLADDFVDEHVKFNVTVTQKSELRKGMVAKLQDEIHFSNIDILQMMVGRNVVFVKFKEHAKGRPAHLDKAIEYTAVNIMSLEFNDEGLITHIRRHHGL